MSKPKRNIELLKRLRTRFLRMRHAEHFKMNTIAQPTECGTAMCIAGHALELAGYSTRIPSYCQNRKIAVEDGEQLIFYTPGGREVNDPLVTAQRLLGLTHAEARRATGADATSGLFYRFDLKTPKQAAALIQEYIDGTR